MGKAQIIFHKSGIIQRGMRIMLGCNQDITVWIRKKVPEVNKEIFVRRILPVKCRWKNYTERTVNNGTSNIYNSVVIIVPYFDGIADFDFDIFDIKEGDIAALGVYDMDIGGMSPHTVSEIRRLLAPNITIINSVAYNFDAEDDINGMKSRNMKGKHLRLTGN